MGKKMKNYNDISEKLIERLKNCYSIKKHNRFYEQSCLLCHFKEVCDDYEQWLKERENNEKDL